jgi:phage terminase small subunit
MKLTPKQQRFVKEYRIDLNATQAAIRAGYSKKTAGPCASRLLANVNIQKLIQQDAAKVAAKLNITAERIEAEYAKIAFSDMANYGSWEADGRSTLRPSSELGEHTAAVQEITVNVTTTQEGEVSRLVKFKLHPKIQALDALCKMKGLFLDRHEVSGPNGGPVPVAVDLSGLSDTELRALDALTSKIKPVDAEPAKP